MAKHLESGKYGEQLATRYLEGQGYSILFVNWRYKRWEIDIVAKERDVLVFVEVKSRSMTSFGEPVDFVDQKKRQHLQEAAENFIEQQGYEGDIRFDIVSVYLADGRVELIKDAFWND
ncbi:YraN family protein [Sphingobacterium sp. T2]|uniref:YraN family protein n=1 Tax=Sphingobacterium sp. T2 TaxID=1590596 RepID=UPI00057B9817|nr:YraN family protein [Sphingobacterium sp. T2]